MFSRRDSGVVYDDMKGKEVLVRRFATRCGWSCVWGPFTEKVHTSLPIENGFINRKLASANRSPPSPRFV